MEFDWNDAIACVDGRILNEAVKLCLNKYLEDIEELFIARKIYELKSEDKLVTDIRNYIRMVASCEAVRCPYNNNISRMLFLIDTADVHNFVDLQAIFGPMHMMGILYVYLPYLPGWDICKSAVDEYVPHYDSLRKHYYCCYTRHHQYEQLIFESNKTICDLRARITELGEQLAEELAYGPD